VRIDKVLMPWLRRGHEDNIRGRGAGNVGVVMLAIVLGVIILVGEFASHDLVKQGSD
jgi:hypothetical protein